MCKLYSRVWLLVLILCGALCLVMSIVCLADDSQCQTPPAPAPVDDIAEDIRIGKEAAEQVAKESKFVEDPEISARVERIGRDIALVACEKEIPATYGRAGTPKFDYCFKVVDDNEVNAFALPGGFIYVNKGLLEVVQSDDELAAVIAHEVAHAAHRHGMYLIRAQEKQMLGLAAVLIAGSALGALKDNADEIALVAHLVSIAKMSAYGQKAEYDADRTAVALLVEAGYNPVGALTLMERLAREELRKPRVNYGIFANHPPSNERATAIIAELNKRGITINRRLVTKYTQVYTKPVDGSSACSVFVGDTEVIRLADLVAERAVARAERLAGKLSNVLLAGAGIHDVKVGGGDAYVVIMGKVVIAPTPEDAEIVGASVADVTKNSASAIRRAMLKERLE